MKTKGKYLLKEKEVIPCYDLIEWAKAFEVMDNQIAKTVLDTGVVSTIFLGLDMSGREPPRLFETMYFPKDGNNVMATRYQTWDEAVKGHSEVVEDIKKGSK